MGRFEDIAFLRIKQSLQETNDEERIRGGTGRRLKPVPMADSIHYLGQAADLFARVSTILPTSSAQAECPVLNTSPHDAEFCHL